MKYDFSKCNNLQFKTKGDGGEVMEGYLKITKRGVIYVFYTEGKYNKSFDSSLQLETRNFEHRYSAIEDFIEWAELHELEIIPRDPETYNDWKVGDRVELKDSGDFYTIVAKLGEVVFLLDKYNYISTLSTINIQKKFRLVLTDYEQELLKAQENKKCPFKEGDKVLVRDSDTSWKFDVFQNYEENACYSYECLGSEYEQCIPLNEHTWKLLGTTDEYKEEE